MPERAEEIARRLTKDGHAIIGPHELHWRWHQHGGMCLIARHPEAFKSPEAVAALLAKEPRS